MDPSWNFLYQRLTQPGTVPANPVQQYELPHQLLDQPGFTATGLGALSPPMPAHGRLSPTRMIGLPGPGYPTSLPAVSPNLLDAAFSVGYSAQHVHSLDTAARSAVGAHLAAQSALGNPSAVKSALHMSDISKDFANVSNFSTKFPSMSAESHRGYSVPGISSPSTFSSSSIVSRSDKLNTAPSMLMSCPPQPASIHTGGTNSRSNPPPLETYPSSPAVPVQSIFSYTSPVNIDSFKQDARPILHSPYADIPHRYSGNSLHESHKRTELPRAQLQQPGGSLSLRQVPAHHAAYTEPSSIGNCYTNSPELSLPQPPPISNNRQSGYDSPQRAYTYNSYQIDNSAINYSASSKTSPLTYQDVNVRNDLPSYRMDDKQNLESIYEPVSPPSNVQERPTDMYSSSGMSLHELADISSTQKKIPTPQHASPIAIQQQASAQQASPQQDSIMGHISVCQSQQPQQVHSQLVQHHQQHQQQQQNQYRPLNAQQQSPMEQQNSPQVPMRSTAQIVDNNNDEATLLSPVQAVADSTTKPKKARKRKKKEKECVSVPPHDNVAATSAHGAGPAVVERIIVTPTPIVDCGTPPMSVQKSMTDAITPGNTHFQHGVPAGVNIMGYNSNVGSTLQNNNTVNPGDNLAINYNNNNYIPPNSMFQSSVSQGLEPTLNAVNAALDTLNEGVPTAMLGTNSPIYMGNSGFIGDDLDAAYDADADIPGNEAGFENDTEFSAPTKLIGKRKGQKRKKYRLRLCVDTTA